MKVVVIPQAYPYKEKPFLTPFLKQYSLMLKEMGFEVTVLHVKQKTLRSVFRKEEKSGVYCEEGIERYTNNSLSFHFFKRINSLLFYAKCNSLLKKYISDKGFPDLVISHFYQYAGFSAAKICKKYGIPLIHVEHSGWLLKNRIPRFERNKLKYVLEQSRSFVCVSETLKRQIENHVSDYRYDNMEVIPNPISPIYTFVPPTRHDDFVFFAAGNLFKAKRFDLLIAAFSKAFDKGEKVKMLIAGSGPEHDKLVRLINRYGENRVFLTGPLNKQEMLQKYIGCDCFVLASEHETFGIVYREAMAVGRPVITTSHQGFNYDWDDQMGIMVPVNDENALIYALKEMFKNKETYSFESISKTCLKKYSFSNIASQYKSLINDIEKRNLCR